MQAAGLYPSLPAPLEQSDFRDFDEAQARIGRLLFFDAELSGNRNISCGTCHDPEFGTSDGLALGVGEGGSGSGPSRTAGSGPDRIKKRIPRNSPGLWNLGAREVATLFHDGRLSVSEIYGNGFDSPAEEWLPEGLNGILAAQALFPLASRFEMAGDPEENEVAGAAQDRIDAPWPILAKRIRTIEDYGRMFVAAFDDVERPSDVGIVHIANALGAFMALEWRSSDSRFDRFLAGRRDALRADEKRGLDLFYGKAGCSRCHSGNLLTDHGFHALALPQFGPGRTRRFDPTARDVGRMGKSDRLADAYRFRTPSLRNVALTAPYGHNGAYATLEGMIRHHLAPRASFESWGRHEVDLPAAPWLEHLDFVALSDRRERRRLASRLDIAPRPLNDGEVADLVAFMHALTGGESVKGRWGKPARVPSGLKVD